jgi:hypothetical protein
VITKYTLLECQDLSQGSRAQAVPLEKRPLATEL